MALSKAKWLTTRKNSLMQHRVKLSQAKALVARMRHSASVEQLEEAWVQYLHTLEQSWHKLEAFYKSYPQWGNWSSVYREERSRPGSLPGYLRAARGADEHSLEEITEREPGGIGINPAHGNVL